MKIKRFNEASEYYDTNMFGDTPEFIKTNDIDMDSFRYIKELKYTSNIDPLNWIENLITLSNLNYKNKQLPKIASEKNLENLSEYIKTRKKINKIHNNLEELKKILNEKYTTGVNELLYTVQEDLLKNDFNTFYNLFIKGWEKPNDFNIHPKIWENYKNMINQELELRKNMGKYNL